MSHRVPLHHETQPKSSRHESNRDPAEKTAAKRLRVDEGPTFSNGMVEFALDPINKHLTCNLCYGYFRDPVTITECLHTFCKSCLFYAFSHEITKCPTCSVDLGTDPVKATLSDRTLQELVDKVLFPNLCAQDMAQEREFYTSKGIRLKPEHEEDFLNKEKPKDDDARRQTTSPTHQNDEYLDFSVHPEVGSEIPALSKPMLRTLGHLKIGQLKSYLVAKVESLQIVPESLDILCQGNKLGNELSLTFVKRTIWLDSKSDLQLTFMPSKKTG